MSLKSQPVTIPATKVHRDLAELIRRIYSGREHFIVEKDGLPIMVMLSIGDYEQMMENHATRVAQFESAAKAIGEKVQQQELDEEMLEAHIEAIREKMYHASNGK